ncbi:MAG: hypothetical protein ABNH02_01995 [Pseudomonadales bacterium]|jgi:hypothetical protein
MSSNGFSYSEYEAMVRPLRGRDCFYEDALSGDFLILRHDVEFSVNRALRLALIENTHSVKATYFFQVASSAYNPFSPDNIVKIKRIIELGHDVGLHFYVSHLAEGDYLGLDRELERQSRMFELGLDISCTKFSFHRPPSWVLEDRDDLRLGMLNAYGESFFEYSNNPTKIKYIADSQHRWAYGYPRDFLNFPKLQILLHPDEWTHKGDSSELEFFASLAAEVSAEFIELLDNETKHFAKHKSRFI